MPTPRRFIWVIPSLLCLWLGYLLIWQRGFYFDDYSSNASAVDILTGQWRPLLSPERIVTYPVRVPALMLITTLAGLAPGAELLARAIPTLMIAANALLLGWLIERMLGSRLAALVGGWLFLMPLYAPEAVLWISGHGYLLRAGLALLFLHACWSALTCPRPARRWVTAAALAFLAMLLAGEQLVSVAAVVPLLAVAVALQREPANYRPLLRRSLCIVGLALLAAAVVYLVLYRNAAFATERMDLDLSAAGLLHRSWEYARRAAWMTISPNWGLRLWSEALALGFDVLRSSWQAMVLAIAASVSMLLTTLTWQTEQPNQMPRERAALAVVGVGAVWCLGAIFLPMVLLHSQQLGFRLLYFPVAGAGVAIAALAMIALRRLRERSWQVLCVALIGAVLLLSTLGMLGYARAFAARSELDRQQVAALVGAVPAQYLPADGYVIPLAIEERPSGSDENIRRLLIGVFESSWTAQDALQQAYRRRDVWALTTNRGVRAKLGRGFLGDYEPGSNALIVLGQNIPLDRAVPFILRDGAALVVDSLTIVNADGSQHVVRFPIAEELRRLGSPTTGYAYAD